MICVGCGEQFCEDDKRTTDGTRHVECVCKCHELGCRNECANDDTCQMIHINNTYQDFLSME